MFEYLIAFSLVSSLFLAVLMVIYKVLLAGQCQARLNRRLLLGIISVSLMALPVLSVFSRPAPVSATVEIEDPIPVIGYFSQQRKQPSWSASRLWSAFREYSKYGLVLGVMLMLGKWVRDNRRILRVIRRGESFDGEDYTLVIVEDNGVAPFSFMQKVVMSRGDYENNSRMIVAHELAHIRHHHWVDLLIARAVVCLQWYNPAAWLLLSELRDVHEYEADARVIEEGFDIKDYQYLLVEKAAGVRFQSLANSLNHSKLKKRIAMMYNQKSSFRQRLRALALVPALAGALGLAQIPAIASMIGKVNSALVFYPLQAESAAAAGTVADSESVSSSVTASASASDGKVTQKTSSRQADDALEKSVVAPEVRPEFPGGIRAMMQFLASNIHYPENALKNNVQGRVVLRFTVFTDGSIGDVKVIKSVSPELDQEAVRVVKSMPRWTPGTVDGKPVNCGYALPVSFAIPAGGSLPAGSKDVPPAVGELSDGTIVVVSAPVNGESKPIEAVYFVNGERFSGNLKDIDASAIESMTVVKNDPDYPQGRIDIVLKK